MTGPIAGRLAAAPQPTAGAAGGFDPSGDLTVGERDGIEVDARRTSRRVLTALGLTVAGAGAALLAVRGATGAGGQLASRFPQILPAAIGAAVLGGGMATFALAGLRAKQEAYTQVVDGSLREAGAAADQLGGDVGIVSAGDGRWGLMALEEAVTDDTGAGEAKLSNPPIKFAAVTSRDGDTWVRSGEAFSNRGSATAIDATSIDPANAEQVQSLVGTRVAVTSNGQTPVTLGQPLLGGTPSASREELLSRLFEAGIDDAALLDTGRGIIAFDARGGIASDDLRARGTGVSPVGALSLLSSVSRDPVTRTLTDVGGRLTTGQVSVPRIDVTDVKVADAANLSGLRVGGSGGSVEKLGAVISTHASVGEAITAGAAAGRRTLVAKLADGAALFQLPGSGANALTTALGGGSGALQVVLDRKKFSVAADGTVRFAARSVPFDTKEPIGSRLDSGSVSGTASKLLGSYPDRGAALAAIRGNLDTATRYAVVEAAGPEGTFHAYELGGSGGTAWDTQLGGTTLGAWRDDQFRRTVEEVERRPSTWGTDLYYFNRVTERTVRFADEGDTRTEVATSPTRDVSRDLSRIVRAFDPNEALGQTVSVGGRNLRIDQYLESTSSSYSAKSFISRSAGDPSAYVVLERENNRGSFHIYRASAGYAGSSWNESRADPEMASWVRDNSRTFDETERRSGQYGTDVYHYDVTERWRERVVNDGYSSNVSDRTSSTRDRVLDYVDRADPPVTSPGDDNGSTSPGDDNGGGSTSPGDDGGGSGGGSGGGNTSPGDDGGSGGSGAGNSTDNGNPSEDDF